MTPVSPLQPLGRRRHLLAVLMAAPTIITALGLSALGAWRFYRPDSSLFVTPPMFSLADAIASGDELQVYDLVRAGQDPSQPIAVRHPVLTRGRSVVVPPLFWAVATEGNQIVSLLLSFGAHIDATMQRRAVCLAEQLGNDDVARLIERYGESLTPEPCPKGQAGEAALLGALAEPE